MCVGVGVVVSAEAVIGGKNICLHWFAVKKNPENQFVSDSRRREIGGRDDFQPMTQNFLIIPIESFHNNQSLKNFSNLALCV
jgi:hypothetical protein